MATKLKRWAIFKDGQLYRTGLDSTKKDLLISYDLIGLRGLDACEQNLIGRGMIPTEVEVEVCPEGEQTFWWETVDGALTTDQDSGYPTREHLFLWRCLHWYLQGTFPGEERKVLHRFYWLTDAKSLCVQDRRRQSTYDRLKVQAEAIFQRHGIAFVPIRVTKAEASDGDQ